MSKWKTSKLGDITVWRSGGTPSKSNPDFWNGEIPWISAKTFPERKVFDSPIRITQTGLEAGSRLAQIDSILLLVRGSGLFNGIPVAIVTNPVSFNQDIKSIEVDKSIVDPMYLLYWLKGNKATLESKLEHTGIGAGKLDLEMLKSLEISYPRNHKDQLELVDVLSSLDDKIELNNEMNKTLEELAQTLFKRWFVDNIDSSFTEKKLSEYFNFLNGFPFKSSTYCESGNYKIITIKAVQDGFLNVELSSKINKLPQKLRDYQILNIGDLLISLTGNVGRVCIVDDINCLLNQRVALITSKNKKWSPFVYFYFRQKIVFEKLISIAKGSAQLNLSPVDTLNLTDIFATDEKINCFNSLVSPIFNFLIQNKLENRILIKLRNILLPNLINGVISLD